MSQDINLIDATNLTDWSTIYHPYELMLSNKTFSFSNLDRSSIWFTHCYFASDGSFGNMPSYQEFRWQIEDQNINIYNKKNEISRVIEGKELRDCNLEDIKELRAKVINRDDYRLFYQDGTREIVGKNFTVLPNLVTYEGKPTQHIDCNLICPPIYLNHSKTSKLLLQFDVKVDDVFNFMTDDTFFIIVGHEKSEFRFSEVDLDVQKLSMNFENLTSKKWKTIAIEIKLSSNYISVGPYLTQKGHAEFKNIKLTELND